MCVGGACACACMHKCTCRVSICRWVLKKRNFYPRKIDYNGEMHYFFSGTDSSYNVQALDILWRIGSTFDPGIE